MLGRLIQKELIHYLLDFRFIAIFALCALLSILSIYVGTENYAQRLKENQAVSEDNRWIIQQAFEKKSLIDLERAGISWTRRPEILSPVVWGLSGELGEEVQIQYQRLVLFEGSPFSVDPVSALFGILDFAFIVSTSRNGV